MSPHPGLPRETLVPLQDVTVHVVDWPGALPVIVGIHGSAGMAHALGALAERLAPAHRFVGVDLRDHGFSDKPPAGYDLERHVADIRQLIVAMGLRRPLLLGHSAGGTIAACVAAVTDVAGLILLEAMIGDRAFTENAVAHVAPIVTQLDKRFAGFHAYLAGWRSRRRSWGDQAERLVERWARFAFAPGAQRDVSPARAANRRGSRMGLDHRGGQPWSVGSGPLSGADRAGPSAVAGWTAVLHEAHRHRPAGRGAHRRALRRRTLRPRDDHPRSRTCPG